MLQKSGYIISLYFFRLAESSGGAERRLITVAKDLSAKGHDVHIVSWDPPGSFTFYELCDGVTWHQLGGNNSTRLGKYRRTLALARMLRQVGADVFVGFVMSTDKTVYTACALARVPIIAAERNSPEMYSLKFGRIKWLLYMGLLWTTKRILIQLEGYRTGYPSWLRSKIDTIPNPVAIPQEFASPATSDTEGGMILLCVARFESQKNLDVLVRAFGLIAAEHGEWTLRIVGEGTERTRLAALVGDLGLSGRVELPGSNEEIELEYVNAHIFCLPSRWEGFPNALAEAMAHGLPVVGFAECPGVNALITHDVNGRLADGNGNIKSLASTLSLLMGRGDLRAQYGAEGRKIVADFNSTEIANRWERVIVSVASGYAK